MPSILGPFDPTSNQVNPVTIAINGPKNYGLFINVSDYQLTLQVKMQSQNASIIVPSRSQKPLVIYGQQIGLTWSSLLTAPTATGPQQFYLELVDQFEYQASELSFLAPTTLTGGSSVSATANSVANDGSIAATQFVESTVQGDSVSSVSLTNDGTLTLGHLAPNERDGQLQLVGNSVVGFVADSANPGVLIQIPPSPTGTVLKFTANGLEIPFVPNNGIFFNLTSGQAQLVADSSVQGIDVEVPDGTVTAKFTTLGVEIPFIAGNGLFFNTSGNPVKISADTVNEALNIDVPNGTRVVQIDTNGMNLKASGKGIAATNVILSTGSIARIAKQTANLNAGTQTYNHNLGWTPDYTIITATQSGGGSATVGWQSPNNTSINITVGATMHYDLLFIKFAP